MLINKAVSGRQIVCKACGCAFTPLVRCPHCKNADALLLNLRESDTLVLNVDTPESTDDLIGFFKAIATNPDFKGIETTAIYLAKHDYFRVAVRLGVRWEQPINIAGVPVEPTKGVSRIESRGKITGGKCEIRLLNTKPVVQFRQPPCI